MTSSPPGPLALNGEVAYNPNSSLLPQILDIRHSAFVCSQLWFVDCESCPREKITKWHETFATPSNQPERN